MKEITVTELEKQLDLNIKSKLEEKKVPKIKELEEYFNSHIENKCILGFDIYQYSQYPSLQQSLIPHLFKKLYDTTLNNCLSHEPNIFVGNDKKKLTAEFIDSGDGGFQIFDNPIQAMVFATYFQANIVRYNSDNELNTSIYNIVGEINLRYCLTFDKLYFYNKNFYGPAIINCARIMSRDRLNRFLIDKNSIVWFNQMMNGIENLQFISIEDLKTCGLFKDFDIEIKPFKFKKEEEVNIDNKSDEPAEKKFSLLFKNEENRKITGSSILRSDILKIGEIKSKLDTLSIYNYYMQFKIYSQGKKLPKYTVSLGNLNSSGLSE